MTTHLLIGDVRRQRRSCQKTKQKNQNKTTTTTQFVSDVPEPISAQRRHRSTFQPVFFLILLILSARSAWVGVVLTPLLAGVRGASPRQLGASVCACPRAGAWSGRETIASTERKGGGRTGVSAGHSGSSVVWCAMFFQRNRSIDEERETSWPQFTLVESPSLFTHGWQHWPLKVTEGLCKQ